MNDLSRLLNWFRHEWEAQHPGNPALHSTGIEFEKPGPIVRGTCPDWPGICGCKSPQGEKVHDAGGGNWLGSRKFAPAFRAYLFADPDACTEEGEIRNPLRFRLYQMQRGSIGNRVASHFLFRLACLDFDVERAGLAMESPLLSPYLEIWAQWALGTLYNRMRSEPVKFVRGPRGISDAQADAEAAGKVAA